MKRLIWQGLLAFLAVVSFAAPAFAKSGSAAYSVWSVDGRVVQVRFMLPTQQAKVLLPGMPRLDDASVAAAAGALLGVTSAAGPCDALIRDQWVGKYYVLAQADGAFRFEMTFQCPAAQGIVLHDGVLFDKTPDHVDYAKVQIGSSAPVLRLLTREHPTLALPTAGPLARERLTPFMKQGLDRLLQGADAAALLAGLLLLSRRWRDLAGIALALACGYATALALVWSSAFAPDAILAEAGMGAAAAILGLCALGRQATEQGVQRRWLIAGAVAAAAGGACVLALAAAHGRAQLLAAGGLVIFALSQAWLAGSSRKLDWLLFAPALLFGLLDGTAWAQRLARLRMPGAQLMPALWGYDLGAVAILAAGAAVLMGVLWVAGRKLKAVQPFGADVAAAAVTGLGVFWFVSRLYSV